MFVQWHFFFVQGWRFLRHVPIWGIFRPLRDFSQHFCRLLALAIQVRGLLVGWWGLKIPQALVWEPYRWGKQANRMFVVVSFCLKIFAKYLILRMLRRGGGDFWHFSNKNVILFYSLTGSSKNCGFFRCWVILIWCLWKSIMDSQFRGIHIWKHGFVECFFMDSAFVEYPTLVGGIWWTGGLVYFFWGNKKVTSLTSVLGDQNPQNCRYLLELSHTIQK